MARELKERLRQVLPDHTKIFIMYGATEASARLAYLNPERYSDKMDSVGQPIPGVLFRIVSPEGNEVSQGIVGELLVTGPNIMQGYWKDPEGTNKILSKNWYHTGDLAHMDEEGFFYIVGRMDDIIKTGGERVSPRKVENILYQMEEVHEAVVVGTPDLILGQALSAFIVLRDGIRLSDKEVLKFCSQRLEPFMVPKYIHFRQNLPKTSNGKIDKKTLSAWTTQVVESLQEGN